MKRSIARLCFLLCLAGCYTPYPADQAILQLNYETEVYQYRQCIKALARYQLKLDTPELYKPAIASAVCLEIIKEKPKGSTNESLT